MVRINVRRIQKWLGQRWINSMGTHGAEEKVEPVPGRTPVKAVSEDIESRPAEEYGQGGKWRRKAKKGGLLDVEA